VEEQDLPAGRKLGSGGEGEVIEVGRDSGLVFKRYLRPLSADAKALRELVDFPAGLPAPDRERLARQAAWPIARVLRDGVVVGFLMRKIPDRFYGQAGRGKATAREFQYLFYEPKPLWGDIRPPDIGDRIAIARDAASLLAFLHTRMMIAGDISMRNILWAPGEAAEIFMIDCDSMRRLGRRPVQRTAHTPGWEDPALHRRAYPGLDNDRYKCALLVGRILSRTDNARPDRPLEILPGVPDRICSAVNALWRQAGARGGRPAADRWAAALAVPGRPRRDLPPEPTRKDLP
jgi:DNA-binding helix-hairpin-helix protein with protein kinase domain